MTLWAGTGGVLSLVKETVSRISTQQTINTRCSTEALVVFKVNVLPQILWT